MANIDELKLSSDAPIDNPKADVYGYWPFAKKISNSISKIDTPHGMVIAINGAWGSGKSSLINLIKHELEADTSDSSILIVEFNPWWFDDKAQLAKQFLTQFKIKLGSDDTLEKIGSAIASYSDALGKVVEYSTGQSLLGKLVSKFAGLWKPKDLTVPALKKKIGTAIKDSNRRFLIVVDDIDRLTPPEIEQVFKVVKALGDFPNVIYLLSFDQAVVAESLNAVFQTKNAEAYLEKIIQVQFVLPNINKSLLVKKFNDDLSRILQPSNLKIFNDPYWLNLFHTGIYPLLNYPRDVVRFVNSIMIELPVVEKDLNIADFLIIEFFKIKHPKLYKLIRSNPAKLSGISHHGINSSERSLDLLFKQSLAESVDPSCRDAVLSTLERIFPRLDNNGRANTFLLALRKDRRVAHPDYFSLYFSFEVDSGVLSKQEILTFVDYLSDLDKTKETLSFVDGVVDESRRSKIRAYIEQVNDYQDVLNVKQAENLVKALCAVGDSVIPKNFVEIDQNEIPPTWILFWAVQAAMKKVPAELRSQVLMSAFEDGEALVAMATILQSINKVFDSKSGLSDLEPWGILSEEVRTDLRNIFLRKIRALALSYDLLDSPQLIYLLFRWAEGSSAEEVKKWLTNIYFDEGKLLTFLVKSLKKTITTSFDSAYGEVKIYIDFSVLLKLADVELINVAIEKLDTTRFYSELEGLALMTFKSQYVEYKNGKEFNDFFDE